MLLSDLLSHGPPTNVLTQTIWRVKHPLVFVPALRAKTTRCARTLQRWTVGHYAATAQQPAYAEVMLQGTTRRGFGRRRTVPYAERLRLVRLPTDTVDAQGSQALVKKAMAQSAVRWKGKP